MLVEWSDVGRAASPSDQLSAHHGPDDAQCARQRRPATSHLQVAAVPAAAVVMVNVAVDRLVLRPSRTNPSGS